MCLEENHCLDFFKLVFNELFENMNLAKNMTKSNIN